MSHQFQPITESHILTTYLLPPSPLPTILPYSTFLTLLPTTYRNNPEYARPVKRLYRDLQFQRDVTLAQVQENIERECGGHADMLRANLARGIAVEEGEETDEGEERRRKRRKVERQQAEENDEGVSDEDDDPSIKDEELSSSSDDDDDDFADPLHLQTQSTFYNDPSKLHPAANVLPIPIDMLAERAKSSGRSNYHTKESLLAAMDNASQSLDSEILELEAECERLKGEIKETVGGLSDLRYGRASKKREEVGEVEGEYKDVLDALARFREVLKGSSVG